MRRTWTIDQLIAAVKVSHCLTEVAIQLGLSPRGGNYNTIGNYIKSLGLNISHFESIHERMNRVRCFSRVKIAHTEASAREFLFQKGVRFTSATRKFARQLIKSDVCSLCSQDTTWNGKLLTLQIDHINGDIYDNRLENLRFICPNCHTQTETFSTRKK